MTSPLTVDQKYKNNWTISPGPVGSVGDVLVTPRLKQSAPDLPMRWSRWAYGQNAPYLGQNVQDGQVKSFNDGGTTARTVDGRIGGRRDFKTNVGWRVEDVSKPDTMVEPFVSSLGDYSWRNRVATTYEARRTGENFLPVPGEYILPPGEMTRGGNSVRVTDVVFGDVLPGFETERSIFGDIPLRANRAGVSRSGIQTGFTPRGGMPRK